MQFTEYCAEFYMMSTDTADFLFHNAVQQLSTATDTQSICDS